MRQVTWRQIAMSAPLISSVQTANMLGTTQKTAGKLVPRMVGKRLTYK